MFTPARSAETTQRVCCAACRAARDRKLARKRRRRDLEGARAEECARQQAWRQQRAAAGCHAPPSPRKCPLSAREIRLFVVRLLERSRASLTRDVRAILLRFASTPGDGPTPAAAMSRATLGAQAAEKTEDSGANLAELSRMSLGGRPAM
jgi:hypothetical protein